VAETEPAGPAAAEYRALWNAVVRAGSGNLHRTISGVSA
jgi:hypothetical protein